MNKKTQNQDTRSSSRKVDSPMGNNTDDSRQITSMVDLFQTICLQVRFQTGLALLCAAVFCSALRYCGLLCLGTDLHLP